MRLARSALYVPGGSAKMLERCLTTGADEVILDLEDSVSLGDKDAARAVAQALLEVQEVSYPRAVGVGGGHYAPRFTEVSLARKISFGHMLPGYAMDLNDPASLSEMIARALEATGTDLAYVHKKSMKRSEAAMISGLVADLGGRVIDSSDLQDL